MRDPNRSTPLPEKLEHFADEPAVQAFVSNMDSAGETANSHDYHCAVSLHDLRQQDYDFEELTLEQYLWRGHGVHHQTILKLDRVYDLIEDFEARGHFPIRMSVDGTRHTFTVREGFNALGRLGVTKLLRVTDDSDLRKVLREMLRAHAHLGLAPLSKREIRAILDACGEHAAADYGEQPRGKTALQILREEFGGIIDGTIRVSVPDEVKKWITNRVKRTPTLKAALGR